MFRSAEKELLGGDLAKLTLGLEAVLQAPDSVLRGKEYDRYSSPAVNRSTRHQRTTRVMRTCPVPEAKPATFRLAGRPT